MHLCSNCFSDIEIKSHINSLSTENGDCIYCREKNVPILAIDEILDFFEELFALYKEDTSGITLIDNIDNDWKLFSNKPIATEIISEILTKTNFSAWSADTEICYIDEIEENISYWEKLKESLKWERRFLVEMENIKDLEWDNFFKDQITFTDTESFFRARIHSIEGEAKLLPIQMGCPEKEKVSSGRGNPQGIPYLYLSKLPLTTLYETKALLHDEVSVGEFKVLSGEELNIVDFTEKGGAFAGVGNLISHTKAIRLKELISKDLSKPIRRYDSNIEYIPTQFICEFIRYAIGADGILFKSSLHRDGLNLVLFEMDKVECIDVKKYSVTSYLIESEEIA
jgi:hypothetical protein